MLKNGSIAEVRTENAIYSPCTILSFGDKSIRIEYCSGLKTLKNGVTKQDIKQEVIMRKDILLITELI